MKGWTPFLLPEKALKCLEGKRFHSCPTAHKALFGAPSIPTRFSRPNSRAPFLGSLCRPFLPTQPPPPAGVLRLIPVTVIGHFLLAALCPPSPTTSWSPRYPMHLFELLLDPAVGLPQRGAVVQPGAKLGSQPDLGSNLGSPVAGRPQPSFLASMSSFEKSRKLMHTLHYTVSSMEKGSLNYQNFWLTDNTRPAGLMPKRNSIPQSLSFYVLVFKYHYVLTLVMRGWREKSIQYANDTQGISFL